MHVLVTGATGLIGSELVRTLVRQGHYVMPAVRSDTRRSPDSVSWDPQRGIIDKAGLEGLDAVVHLAGESIAGRWTDAKKQRIRESRVNGTRLLCEAIAELSRPPGVLISASAIGLYGDGGDETLTEASPPGCGFLPELCCQWESATAAAEHAGIRVVHLRMGMVLTPIGGALARMLTPFRLGLGGRIGHGRQYVSWIAREDVLGAIQHSLLTDSLRGPVNATAPHPVTNRQFTATLGRVLRRPTVLPVPAFAARLAFGEMAQELLLAGARVEPRRLLETGYRFRLPDLEDALRHMLAASAARP